LKSLASASSTAWLPICLPRYNPEGFLHVYVSFIAEANPLTSNPRPDAKAPTTTQLDQSYPPDAISRNPKMFTPDPLEEGASEISLVVVSSRKDQFEKVHNWAESIEEVRFLVRALFPCCFMKYLYLASG
jgi:hypothetical protein